MKKGPRKSKIVAGAAGARRGQRATVQCNAARRLPPHTGDLELRYSNQEHEERKERKRERKKGGREGIFIPASGLSQITPSLARARDRQSWRTDGPIRKMGARVDA
jgi:hypothetical protein